MYYLFSFHLTLITDMINLGEFAKFVDGSLLTFDD